LSTSELYIGISGVGCEVDSFDLGHGVVLNKTYAHLFAPFMMAFARPENEGQHHPAPWAAAKGGLAFDLTLQLTIPSDVTSNLPCDQTTAGWWLTALMRLRAGPRLRVPAMSNYPLAKESAAAEDLRIHPVEVEPHQLMIDPEAKRALTVRDLEWTRDHWIGSLAMLDESSGFAVLLESVDQAAFHRNPQLAMLTLWTGIEEVFSPSKSELRYRISSVIAAYLEPLGRTRLARQKAVAKLYDSRSTAAHGRGETSLEPLWDTYDLARQAVVKMVAERHVPTKAELEERMFGVEE